MRPEMGIQAVIVLIIVISKQLNAYPKGKLFLLRFCSLIVHKIIANAQHKYKWIKSSLIRNVT